MVQKIFSLQIQIRILRSKITLKRYIGRPSRIKLIGVQHVTLKFSTGSGSSEKNFFLTNLDSSPQIYPEMLYLKVWPSNTFWKPTTCRPQACYRPLVTAVLNFRPSYFSYIVILYFNYSILLWNFRLKALSQRFLEQKHEKPFLGPLSRPWSSFQFWKSSPIYPCKTLQNKKRFRPKAFTEAKLARSKTTFVRLP